MFIWLTGYGLSLKEDGNPETRAEAKATKELCLLASVSSGLFNYLSHKTQAHLPRDDIAHHGLGLPLSISNQENAQRYYPMPICRRKVLSGGLSF